MIKRKITLKHKSTKLEDEYPLPKSRQYFRQKLKLISLKGLNICNLKIWEVAILLGVFLSFYYVYFYYDNFHFHVVRSYAWAGYDEAQHRVGQHYISGRGVEKHPEKAMEYFKLAADQGHGAASHNLAVGHVMKHTSLAKGETRRLLKHALSKGVEEAEKVLTKYCDRHRVCHD